MTKHSMLLFIKTKTVFGIYLLFYCKISMPSQCNIQGKYFPDRPNREENHMNTYAWVKPACYGAAGGAVALAIIGFSWGGWVTAHTAQQNVEAASQSATVAALAPICAAKFERAAKIDNGLVNKLGALNSWDRKSHLMKAGWATFPGGAQPDSDVAQACAKLLSTTYKLK
jgi:hypothetical protein